MPFNATVLGNQLIAAGKHQASTGKRLKRSATRLRRFGTALERGEAIEASIVSIRSGARIIRVLLVWIGDGLEFIAEGLRRITVPTISTKTRDVDFPVIGRVRFITKLSIDVTQPFVEIATRLTIVEENVRDIGQAMKDVVDGLSGLRGALPEIRKSLTDTADEMESGGDDLITAAGALQAAGKRLRS